MVISWSLEATLVVEGRDTACGALGVLNEKVSAKDMDVTSGSVVKSGWLVVDT
jgi:hypothetical protein